MGMCGCQTSSVAKDRHTTEGLSREYAKLRTSREKARFCFRLMEQGIIRSHMSVAVLKSVFGEDFDESTSVKDGKLTAYIWFADEDDEVPDDDAAFVQSPMPWHMRVRYSQDDGHVWTYSLSNATK